MASAADKYREAIELYASTDLTLGEISRRCGVTRSGLASYIRRAHRDLMLKRAGVNGDPEKRIWKSRGQRPDTRRKYREAIEACDSEEYIDLNVSQIASLFDLDGTGLANQLRTHYPEIIPRREAARQRLALADNFPRGARDESTAMYEKAVEMLQSSDMTIEEAAEACGVSYPGLRQHIIFYHKDIGRQRDARRRRGKATPKIGTLSGNGQIREMAPDVRQRYAESVELYRTTSLPVTEIAKITGVNLSSLRDHLRIWHKRLMFERRGASLPDDASDHAPLAGKRYSKSASEKYSEAIALLKSTDISVEAAAKKFGFIPEVFRAYLREHEPELFESLGMIRLPNGRLVLKRSYERYRQAIEAYSTTGESLKSIAARFGLTYNSLGGFIRRNLPELKKS